MMHLGCVTYIIATEIEILVRPAGAHRFWQPVEMRCRLPAGHEGEHDWDEWGARCVTGPDDVLPKRQERVSGDG